jgi:cytochrome c-type biogenesis protein CcmF
MIPEIGHFALILSLCIALVQGVVPLVGAQRGMPDWMAVARPAAQAQFLFLLISTACLAYAFLHDDFSVLYVASNSNTALPPQYKFSAVWGAHEGSLLIWALMLAGWGAAVSWFSRAVPEQVVARVLAVMGLVSIGFLLFMLLTSNPFERLFPAPVEGRDLNPLLQDPGLVIHPPMLYMGYVGFAVAFAFAIAAMLGGRLDAAWARWSRPWTTIAWVFLTLGIALGSWWAYYELGWGGWWFWDPVENASFMPWLVGTALMHSLAVTEKRGTFKLWTVLLAVFTFSLSLLGTFLVRSGVLTSVHAFATDPERGVFVLLFLLVVIGSSLALFAWRAPQIRSSGTFDLFSRESGLLVNNVLLLVTACSVLLGTLYPLILDALNMGKISVGPPYFNSVFIPLMAPVAMLVGVGAMARWKKADVGHLIRSLRIPLIASLVLGLAWPAVVMDRYEPAAAFGMVLAFWVMLSNLTNLIERARGPQGLLKGLMKTPRAFWGMTLGHLGIAVFIVGVTLTSLYSIEKDVKMSPGETYEAGGYTFYFDSVHDEEGPNYTASRGTFIVSKEGRQVAWMNTEKRVYRVQTMPMTEAAIDPGLTRDLYIALGEPVGDTGAWAVRIYHKPYIRWIWMAGLFMAVGGILAASDRRYRIAGRRVTRLARAPVGAEGSKA